MFKYAWRRFKFGAIVSALILGGGYALAQTGSGSLGGIITSPVTVGGFLPFNAGPQSSVISAHGGTVTCTGGGTPTVTDTNLTANSVIIFGLKTKGGTPAQPIMTTVTPATSFVITCGGSDTSVYNYWILG
jgi:hypothetical protein